LTSRETFPLHRCCLHHANWAILGDHLIREFPAVSEADVVRELGEARRAVESVGLEPPDDLFIAELIARNQLSMLAGEVADAARLDPQTHARSSRDIRASA
jgi:hypothetical protein